MRGYCNVVLVGNLTRDPETITTAGGMNITNFCIAYNKTTKSGENVANYIDCTAFDKTADVIQRYVKKADPLLVEGDLRLDQWKDQQGNNRSKLKVIVNRIVFLQNKSGGDQTKPDVHNRGYDQSQPPIQEQDIPF